MITETFNHKQVYNNSVYPKSIHHQSFINYILSSVCECRRECSVTHSRESKNARRRAVAKTKREEKWKRYREMILVCENIFDSILYFFNLISDGVNKLLWWYCHRVMDTMIAFCVRILYIRSFLARSPELQSIKVNVEYGSVKTCTKFEAEIYVLTKDESGRRTIFLSNYISQFYLRTANFSKKVHLSENVTIAMTGMEIISLLLLELCSDCS
ncbi:elongation factor Tu, mitochondrial [Artemisia annua]|uniref:Elongation factor Tu, mitochondrial n=1 Tax=Artemisia annua TaxID=35608 RepID=A0A2U1N9F0_ARTAN|nr:elongation factor Tu, mitochondrial [Artemisia annua]